MSRRGWLCLGVLAAGCGEPPPPPPPPPPTPQQRIDVSKARLQALAEEQLQAAPADARLQLWVAAFRGQDTPDGLRALPPSPLAATALASWSTSGAAEEVDPTSSFSSLFKARAILATARGTPDFWKPATEAVEEALKRNAWDCPVRSFHAWALAWLEKNEPDLLARAAFRFPYENSALSVLQDLSALVEGAAYAPAPPRHEAQRLADLLGRLVEDRLARSPDAAGYRRAQAVAARLLPARFLLAWRRGTLEPAQAASLGMEEWGRREAGLGAHAGLPHAELETALRPLFLEGALKPPFAFRGPLRPAAETPERAAWRKEAVRDLEKGAKAALAAERAEAERSTPFAERVAARRPARSPFENFLGKALRDRDFLFTDAWPKDRLEQLLDVAFNGPGLASAQALGLDACAWIVRDNLRRPKTIPTAAVERRAAKADAAAERAVEDMNIVAVLTARKESTLRRPAPADVRKAAPPPSALQGYARLLEETLKTRAIDALDWLPEPEGATPSAREILIAETLRGATEQDFGPDWGRWRTRLESGK